MRLLNNFGRILGVNADAELLQDGTKAVVAADTYVYGGMPMTFYKPDGATEAAVVSYGYMAASSLTANVAVAGIAKFNKNVYLDETYDALSFNGSGKGTVIQAGRVTLSGNTFRQQDGSLVTVFGFVTGLTYVAMEKLYVDLTLNSAGLPGANYGKITNTLSSGVNDATFLGYVSNYWASSTSPCLEILLKVA